MTPVRFASDRWCHIGCCLQHTSRSRPILIDPCQLCLPRLRLVVLFEYSGDKVYNNLWLPPTLCLCAVWSIHTSTKSIIYSPTIHHFSTKSLTLLWQDACAVRLGWRLRGGSQVSFQGKNPDFLLRNPDFLSSECWFYNKKTGAPALTAFALDTERRRAISAAEDGSSKNKWPIYRSIKTDLHKTRSINR